MDLITNKKFGEGHGNPLQCSCLENPRDGRAWWAAVYGVTQSQTRLKRISSSSSNKSEDQIKLKPLLPREGKPFSHFKRTNFYST